MKAFDIFLNGSFIDTVYFGTPKTIKDVIAYLVADGYSSNINVNIVYLGSR